MKAITIETLYSGHFIENDHRYADEMYWSRINSSFLHRIVRCHAGVDGTCQCNSHDSHYEICISPDKAVELLRSWGIVLENNIDASSTRLRVENALESSSLATLLTIAKLLDVEVALYK